MAMIKKQDGFTLIEVMMAVVILAIVLVPISMVFVGARKNTVKTKELLEANEIASMYMENLKAKTVGDIEKIIVGDDSSMPVLSSLGAYTINCRYDGNEITSASGTREISDLPAITNKKYEVEITFNKASLSDTTDMEAKLGEVETSLSTADIRVGINNGFSVGGTSLSSTTAGDKTIDIEFLDDKKTCKFLLGGASPKDCTMDETKKENIIVFNYNGPLKDKTTVNIANKSMKKLSVFITNEEEKNFYLDASGNKKRGEELVFNIEDGWVAINKGVSEKVRIKSAVLEATVVVKKKNRLTGALEKVLDLHGSITNE